MPVIFRYFWFLCAGFMMINIIVWKRAFATIVQKGRATQAEADQFIRWTTALLVGGSLAFGLIGLLAGWSSPFCAGILLFTDVPRAIVSSITVASWVGLLWWVWRGSGADFLSRVAPALGQRPVYDKSWSPQLVRLAVTAFALATSVGAVVASRFAPVPFELACPVVTEIR